MFARHCKTSICDTTFQQLCSPRMFNDGWQYHEPIWGCRRLTRRLHWKKASKLEAKGLQYYTWIRASRWQIVEEAIKRTLPQFVNIWFGLSVISGRACIPMIDQIRPNLNYWMCPILSTTCLSVSEQEHYTESLVDWCYFRDFIHMTIP